MPASTAHAPVFPEPAGFDDVPAPALLVAIIYDDHVAYRRAVRLLANALCDHEMADEVRPLPWRFEDLQFQPWRERALEAAEGADVFVIATAGKSPLPQDVIDWLELSFARRAAQPTAVIALHNPDDDPHRFGALSEAIVRRLAEFAGLHFLEPAQLSLACPR
jgi:hypothetical protein